MNDWKNIMPSKIYSNIPNGKGHETKVQKGEAWRLRVNFKYFLEKNISVVNTSKYVSFNFRKLNFKA